MARRNDPGVSLVAGMLVLGAIWWVIAKLLVLIAAGATLALTWWLAKTLAQALRVHASAAHLTLVERPQERPRLAPVPDTLYRQTAPVDRRVFDDTVMAEGAALQTFDAWAARLPHAPPRASALVRSLDMRIHHVGRLVSEIAERTIEERSAPAALSEHRTRRGGGSQEIDPWAFTVSELRRTTRWVEDCDGCHSEGSLPCSYCGGTTRTTCQNCNGERKAYGRDARGARRKMNCRVCAAKGQVDCTACNDGQVRCSLCAGSGKVAHWFEYIETAKDDVQVEPDGEITKAFRWGRDGVPASPEEIAADAKVVGAYERSRPLTPEDVSALVSPDWLDKNWAALQPTTRRHQRIMRQSFWLLEIPSIEISYGLPGAALSTISVKGLRMLAPPPVPNPQFIERARSLRNLRVGLAAVCVVVPLVYLARGAFFVSGAVAALAACVISASLAVDRFQHAATLGRAGARPWAAAAAGAAVMACVFAALAEPTLRAARRDLARGQLDDAEAQLTALGDATAPDRTVAWADLQLARTLKETDPKAAAEQSFKIEKDLPQRLAAAAYVNDLAMKRVEEDLAAGHSQRALDVLRTAQPPVPSNGWRNAAARVHLAESHRCLAARDWPCIFAEAKEAASLGAEAEASSVRAEAIEALRAKAEADSRAANDQPSRAARISATATAIESWGRWLAAGGAPEPAVVVGLRSTLERLHMAEAKDDARRQIAQAKEEAGRRREEERRAREAERAEARRLARDEREAARAARREREASRALLCCDGSLSPSCMCHGSHQGCCSHHGGVCGCE